MTEAVAILDTFLARNPYARYLGVTLGFQDGAVAGSLPYAAHLIGNPRVPALHGGAVAAFMELTALAQLAVLRPGQRLAKPADITIDYLRFGRALATRARAEVLRIGRQVANVQVLAWQDDPAKPIAALRGHFLLEPSAVGG